MEDIEKLKYPIGELVIPEDIPPSTRYDHIKAIGDLPKALQRITSDLSDQQLDTPYRLDGWTVRQLIHNIADSHINAFTKFKLELTEDKPTIRPNNQDAGVT